MKYTNASQRLPKKLLEQIQEYVQGEYIYIPIKNKQPKDLMTDYKIELRKRDAHIYTKHLEGVNNKQISQMYNLSESSIRRIIIKQRKRYRDMMGKMNNIIRFWGLGAGTVQQVYDTAWQIDNQYILKKYDDLSMLERNLKIVCILENMNIPVGRIVTGSSGKLYAEDGDFYYCLSEKLPGNNLVDLSTRTDIGVVMGETIADLHLAFKECEKEREFWNNSLLEEMRGWIRESFEKNEWKYINREVFEMALSKLAKHYNSLPVQLIHRDVHFGNFLFHNGKFSGYIDFDLSQKNIRIFDLCYFLLGLLSEEEKLSVTGVRWFELVKDVFKGYERKCILLPEEKEAVPYVMECIELLFVAYFNNVNDTVCAENAKKIFEFVAENEDRVFNIIN